jgi:hypothetical protein
MQSREARPSTMLNPLFVAGVLEGFEGTLDEVVGRVEDPALNTWLDKLRRQIAALRNRIESPLGRVEGDRIPSGR